MRGNLGRAANGVISLMVVMAAPLACTGATGDVRGGEVRFDATPPQPFVLPCLEPTFADATPTSWKGVYRDFFGCHSKASCAGNGNCHGSADKAGARSSSFVCADIEGCYKSIRTGKKTPTPTVPLPLALVEAADVLAPENARLFSVLRYRGPEGILENKNMPQAPSDFVYTAADVEVMKAWIRAGAKDD